MQIYQIKAKYKQISVLFFAYPEPEYYQYFCQRVHGLCEADTDDAPVFPYVWEKIKPMLEGLPFVAHNNPFDEGCLKAVFKVYQMDYPDYKFYDTLIPFRSFLKQTNKDYTYIYYICNLS